MENESFDENLLMAPPPRRRADSIDSATSGMSGNHTETSQSELDSQRPTSGRETTAKRMKRKPWTTAEYRELLYCYFYRQRIAAATEKSVYEMWRSRNGNLRPDLTSRSLATQRRFIMNNKKLSEIEIDAIREEVARDIDADGGSEAADGDVEENAAAQQELHMEEREAVDINRETVTCESALNSPIGTQPASMVLTAEQLCLRSEIEMAYQSVGREDVLRRRKLPRLWENDKVRRLLSDANKVLNVMVGKRALSLTDINNLVYATAVTISRRIVCVSDQRRCTDHHRQPAWRKRLESKINRLRKELSLLTDRDRITKAVSRRKLLKIYRRYNIRSEQECINMQEVLKQKIQMYAQRIRRYNRRSQFYKQNKMFSENTRHFYRCLNSKSTTNDSAGPAVKLLEEYWGGLWEKEVAHNQKAAWISREEERTRRVPFMEFQSVTIQSLRSILNDLPNWKAAGPDQVTNFWLKKLDSLHQHLAQNINKAINQPEECPPWLTQGLTILIPKKDNPALPSEYRPITCLSVFYKLITSLISRQIYNHLDNNRLLPPEQKGCARGSYGCKELLLLNKLLIQHAKTNHRSIAMAWVDYRKAFDSIPHTWIQQVVKIYHLDPNIVNFCTETMKTWKTRMILNSSEGFKESRAINIRTGIFQGDSLSPLLFCMALIPLTNELNETKTGYSIMRGKQISHLIYMDDLKLYAKNEQELKKLLNVVHKYSNDINMKFGLDKCAKAYFERGNLKERENLFIDGDTEINDLQRVGMYRYLGVEERDGVEGKLMKDRVRKEYYRRIRDVLKSELSGANKIKAISSLAVPVFTYSAGILDWNENEIQGMDRKTRKLLTMYGILHPRADVCRLYVPRVEGGRGLTQIAANYKQAIVGLGYYLRYSAENKTVQYIRLLEDLKMSQKGVIKVSKKLEARYNITEASSTSLIAQKDRHRRRIKEAITAELRTEWLKKPLHGQFNRQTQKESINRRATYGWLKYGGMRGETESLLIAAQDQALRTHYYEKNILRLEVDGRCRLCKEAWETVDHIVSGCSVLAQHEYIQRHNRVCSFLHYEICKANDIPVPSKWYLHQPEAVTNGPSVTILYDQQVHTDRSITANRPDIILRNELGKTCLIIDVSVPQDSNVDKKEAEKCLKYRDLAIEIERMWMTKTEVIPIVIGALGTATNTQSKYLKKIGQNINPSLVQSIALYGTAHVLRRVLA